MPRAVCSHIHMLQRGEQAAHIRLILLSRQAVLHGVAVQLQRCQVLAG